jgi:hypothetical protein
MLIVPQTAHGAGGLFSRLRARSQPTSASAYQVALASAQYRAANCIHGHTRIERGRTSGVGYSSFDATPTTCLGVGGNYAVARGRDGWYATKVR